MTETSTSGSDTPVRRPRLRPDDLSETQRALYTAIVSGPRAQGPQLFRLIADDGALNGPFGGFLLSPPLGEALQRLGAAIRYESNLTGRVREMAILAVAAKWDSAFERHAHEAVGRATGLTEQEMSAIHADIEPELEDPIEVAALRLTRALLAGDVSDTIWRECVPPLDEATVFELTTLVGYYATLALQLRVFRADDVE